MGAILRVDVISMPFNEVLHHTGNVPIYGALLQGNNIYTTALKHGLIVIGNEANGISPEVMKHITNPITVPSAGSNGSESLNAANACAIICSEFHRQLHFAS
jgi:TrmH family RNA methyltransferase